MTVLLLPDGSVREITPKNGSHWTTDELCELVGGWPERLTTTDGRIMVVNDSAKLQKMYRGNLNTKATRLYVGGRQDVIIGPAVVVDCCSELDGPEETPV